MKKNQDKKNSVWYFTPFFKIVWTFIISFLAIIGPLFFSGCSNEPDRSVIEFITETKKEKSGEIKKLPSFTKVEPYRYTATNLRSPFEAQSISQAEKPKPKRVGPEPDMKRPKELLESYPLDGLHMVGSLERNGKYWALIKDPHDLVHLVSVGNYMGENFGKVIKIEERGMVINEIVSDGLGGYRERVVNLKMRE